MKNGGLGNFPLCKDVPGKFEVSDEQNKIILERLQKLLEPLNSSLKVLSKHENGVHTLVNKEGTDILVYEPEEDKEGGQAYLSLKGKGSQITRFIIVQDYSKYPSKMETEAIFTIDDHNDGEIIYSSQEIIDAGMLDIHELFERVIKLCA